MGLLDRLLGRPDRSRRSAPVDAYASAPTTGRRGGGTGADRTDDERAVDRYRYMLRTAPPEQIESAHAEAFAKLTPAQRQQVLADLGQQVPASERATSDDPRSLARMATRAEVRSPGTLERSFGGGYGGRGGGFGGGFGGGGLGMGSVIGGSLLASVAGAFVGTAIADAMFDGSDGDAYADGYQDGAEADQGDAGDDAGAGDGGGYEDAGYDGGGGDFGGGDFDV